MCTQSACQLSVWCGGSVAYPGQTLEAHDQIQVLLVTIFSAQLGKVTCTPL